MDNDGRTMITDPSRHPDIERWGVRRPRSRRLRRFLAKYVRWTEFFGYAFVILVSAAIAFCWFYQVNEVCKADANPVIKPYTETLKSCGDVMVTRVLVKEREEVKKEQPLVEVCIDPQWLDRQRTMAETESTLNELKKLAEGEAKEAQGSEGSEGPEEPGGGAPPPARSKSGGSQESQGKTSSAPSAPSSLHALIAKLEHRVADWKEEWKRAPTLTLHAPIAGRVMGADELEGKQIAADKDILKVVDLNDLRITAKLVGTNVDDVRLGQEAKIEIALTYGTGAVLRADTRLSRWRSLRLQFNELLDGEELKNFLSEQLQGLKVTAREEIVLEATEVSELSLDGSVKTKRIAPKEVQLTDQAALEELEKARSEEEVWNAVETYERNAVVEELQRLELKGALIEGKHVSAFTLKELPERVQKELQRKVAEALKGKIALAHEQRQSLWDRVRGRKPRVVPLALSMEKLATLIPTVKLKAELYDPADAKDRERWEQKWRKDWYQAKQGDRSDRAYEGVVRLKNPPQELKDKVWELMNLTEPQNLATTTWVVTNQRRLALMLFKQR